MPPLVGLIPLPLPPGGGGGAMALVGLAQALLVGGDGDRSGENCTAY
ncbi:hypothetical protein PGN35_007860 [Nodosilinea sp. PGN35]